MVEVRGLEPLSKITLYKLSPSAAYSNTILLVVGNL